MSVLGGFRPTISLRRFWCALKQREVEVAFEVRGLPGLRSPVAVRRCSAFERPTSPDCGRRCVDPTFRRQWAPALPIGARP